MAYLAQLKLIYSPRYWLFVHFLRLSSFSHILHLTYPQYFTKTEKPHQFANQAWLKLRIRIRDTLKNATFVNTIIFVSYHGFVPELGPLWLLLMLKSLKYGHF